MEGNITRLKQIGIATTDLEKRIAEYAKVGIGPFTIVADTIEGIGAPASNTKYKGIPTDCNVRVAVCVLDGFEIELVQPLDDKGTYAEHIRQHGDNVIHHVAIETSDNSAFRKIMKTEGIQSIWKGDVDPKLGMSFEYFDTSKELGYIVEMHDPEPIPDEE